jgi:chromosome segregation ATPase
MTTISEETHKQASDSFIEEEGITRVSQIILQTSVLNANEKQLLVDNIKSLLGALTASMQNAREIANKKGEIEDELSDWQQKHKILEDVQKKQNELLNSTHDTFNELKTNIALKKEENWLIEEKIQIMEEDVREKEDRLNEEKENVLKAAMPEKERIDAEQAKLSSEKLRLEPLLGKKEEYLKVLKKQKETLLSEREKQEKDTVKLLQDIADRSEAPMRKEKELFMLRDRNQLFAARVEKHHKRNDELKRTWKDIEANIEKNKLLYEQQIEAFNEQSTAFEKNRVKIAEIKNSLRRLKADQMEAHDSKIEKEARIKRVIGSIRDKDQTLRKIKCEINSLKNELKNLKNEADKMKFAIMEEKNEYERLTKQQEILKKKIQDMKAKNDSLKFEMKIELSKYESLQNIETADKKLIQSKQKQLADLEELLKELREIEVEALRNCKEAAELRSIMSRKACSTQEDLREIQEELAVKELLILDCNKKNQALEREMQKFKKLYECVKNERNGYVNSLQLTSQNKAEIQEKFKGLLREIEILKNTLADKNKTYKNIKNSILFVKRIRDKRKNKLNKMEERRRKMEEQQSSLMNEINKLTNMVSALDNDVLFISRKNDSGYQQRNSLGRELIKANEDLCLMYNDLNIKKSQQNNIQKKFVYLQRNFQYIKTQIVCLEKTNEIMGKKCDELPLLSYQIVELTNLLDQEKTKERELLENLQNPESNTNLRHLKSEDVAIERLNEKIGFLESRINQKKDVILQKKVVLEDLIKTIGEIDQKNKSTRHEDLQKNSNFNRMSNEYNKLMRKVVALVSELSIFQANCIKLEHDKESFQSILKTVESNVAQGLPPLSDTELKYLKMIRNEQIELETSYQRKMEAEFMRNIDPFVKKTTAQKRVDSYFNSIGLPQPYGAFKPFMPLKQSTHLRHYRNPIPIEEDKENSEISEHS